MQYLEKIDIHSNQKILNSDILHFKDYIPVHLVKNLVKKEHYAFNYIQFSENKIVEKFIYTYFDISKKSLTEEDKEFIYNYFENWKNQTHLNFNSYFKLNRIYFKDFEQYLFQNNNINTVIRNSNYKFNCNLFYLSSVDEIPNIYFTLVIHKKYIQYYRLCLLLEQDVDLSIFEFWIRKDIDVPKGNYDKVRNIYRKFIKPEILDKNIEIIFKDNIEIDLFKQFELPNNIITIPDYNNYLDNLSKDFLQSLK